MTSEDRLYERLLILRYQAGDEEVFAELVTRYHGPLTYFVRRLAKDSATAEDILAKVRRARAVLDKILSV